MEYYTCPYCQTVSVSWPGLLLHIRSGHRDEEIPSKEDIQIVGELPDGYKVVGKRKAKAPKIIEEPIGEGPEGKEEITVPKELPEDFIERTKLSLTVHGFPSRLITQILNILALHPETHDNPNNYANLLAHICSTYSGGATQARKISLVVSEVFGPPTQEMPYAGVYGQQATPWYMGGSQGGYGVYGTPPGAQPRYYEDPITKWINYQMWKESKEEEPKGAKLPSAIEARLSGFERVYQESIEDFRTVIERLDKLDKKDEEDKLEKRFARLEEKLEGKKKEGGENNWLQAFLNERDKREDEARKRLEDIIKAQSDKLAEATERLAESREHERRAAAEALQSEEERMKKYEERLKEHGWSPRERKGEEELLDIAKTEVIPGLVAEVRETGKALRRVVGSQPIPGMPSVPETPVSPVTAEKMAEAMKQREEIRKLQEES